MRKPSLPSMQSTRQSAMIRRDEAVFVAVVLAATLILGLLAAELLAQVLQPVSEALMQGTEVVTVEVTP